jgi:hypothetical protein
MHLAYQITPSDPDWEMPHFVFTALTKECHELVVDVMLKD